MAWRLCGASRCRTCSWWRDSMRACVQIAAQQVLPSCEIDGKVLTRKSGSHYLAKALPVSRPVSHPGRRGPCDNLHALAPWRGVPRGSRRRSSRVLITGLSGGFQSCSFSVPTALRTRVIFTADSSCLSPGPSPMQKSSFRSPRNSDACLQKSIRRPSTLIAR